MSTGKFKTFWDIEREKTWRIYLLFGILILFYFCPIFIVWIFVKFLIHVRYNLHNAGASFSVFGMDTGIVLVVAAVASVIHWYYSSNRVVARVLHLLGAKYPDKNDRYHYIFQNVVDEIETSAGGIQVEPYVLPTGAMNAFALADLKGRKVVGITEGLVSRLSREELQAVVAHEISHIISNDCLQTTIACSLFNLYSEALAHFNRALSRGEPISSPVFGGSTGKDAAAVGLLSIPVLILLFITDVLGQLLNMFISREREYRADASAVKLTRNPLSLASALYKIGTHWRGAGYGGEYLSSIFILSPEFNRFDEQEDFVAALFSTHPPLIRRLQVILNLAHADINEISESLRSIRGIKSETEVKKPAFLFHARHGNKWQGPYTILQLQTNEWLEPGTELRIEGGDEVIRANEVPALSYFFEQRDEPIYKMKRLCPDCRQWLIVEKYEGLCLWHCAFCGGMLVEGDKLPRIFVRKEKGFSERVQRVAVIIRREAKKKQPDLSLVRSMSHPRNCPKCGKGMSHKFYSYAYHVEIDECQTCNLTWFDADELEILQCLIEMEEGKTVGSRQ